MRKGDQQELEKLRSYRQSQELVIEQQSQKIARLEAELKRARTDLAEAQRQQQDRSKLEHEMEKQKRAFMRHHKKEAEKAVEKAVEKWKVELAKWKENDRSLCKLGSTILDAFSKMHPEVDLSTRYTKVDNPAIDLLVGHVILQVHQMEKAQAEAKKVEAGA